MLHTSTAAFVRSTLLALALASLFLLILTVSNLYLVFRTQDYAASATEAEEVRRAAADLLLTIQQVESGQRGYLIAQDPSFLTPYKEGLIELPEKAAALRLALEVADLPGINVEGLADNIDNKLKEMNQSLNYAMAGQLDEAVSIVRKSYGVKLMAELDTKLTRIVDQSGKNTTEIIESQAMMANLLKYITIIGIAAMVAVMGAAATIISRFVREILQTRQALKVANEGLEERVQQRTADLTQANAVIQRGKEQAEILLSEVNHRVANSLALVAALIRLQISNQDNEEIKQVLTETHGRIGAVAGMHRSLYTSDDVRQVDMDLYLERLVQDLGKSTNGDQAETRFSCKFDPIRLASDKAVSVGVILTELLTNAIKYAYPEDPSGKIEISFLAQSDNQALLVVEDDGVGLGDDTKGTGLGSRIIASMAASLGSGLCYREKRQGTRAEVNVTL